jgi:hypothetical protein
LPWRNNEARAGIDARRALTRSPPLAHSKHPTTTTTQPPHTGLAGRRPRTLGCGRCLPPWRVKS